MNSSLPGLTTYQDLHAWSVDPKTAPDFWRELFIFENLKPGVVPEQVIQNSLEDAFLYPPPQFFPAVRMNFAEHIFQNKRGSDVAIYACGEGGSNPTKVTWSQLKAQTQAIAGALIQLGVQAGDRVAAIISNCVETIVACLATLSIGAIWSTSSPDMGVAGIMDRLTQIRPKVVFFEASVVYNSKLRDLRGKVAECIGGLQGLSEFKLAIIIQRDALMVPQPSAVTKTWEQFAASGTGRELTFTQLPFSHPGFIVYSSGTTGSPKCIVHSACGLLMQVKKDYMLHLDVKPGDIIYQYTTTGWIMWAMVLCGLSYGGSIVIYDGSPFVPDPMVTLRLASQLKISLFGTSARFLSDLKRMDIKPRDVVDISSLRTVTSTGSVLETDVCEWFYDHAFPPNVHLISSSGGTDLACALIGGDPTSPLYAGEIQVPALGMAVDVFDSSSDSHISIQSTGDPGELVCRQPFPSQPVQFWGPGGEEKYKSAYFDRYGPNVWHQGDFVSVLPSTGGYTMLGRSDGVLNPSGVRFGSAEIYSVTSKISQFEDTICVGQRRPSDRDETVLLFVKMKDKVLDLTPDLIASTKAAIRSALSPRHVPKFIFQVNDIPYTVNGKKIELAVKQIVSGKKVTPSGSVANPESLKQFARFLDLEGAVAIEESRISKI
ncbi:acetoacetyl-synthase [Ilyonectria sp. MPI-CAGE-AT-0026]|nr:acetoacetyl-synthase [Ilyonectria sp. MPI-CAGE-AT-0026]